MTTIRKRKMKKNVIYLFLGIVIIFVISILGLNYYNDYKYRQTNEFKLLEKGYTKEETSELIELLKEEKIMELLAQEKDERILPLIKEKYYIESNMEKYLAFQEKNTDKSMYDIVAIVNVHADQEWYETIIPADTSLNNLVLVNKFYQLEKEYTPENITTISNWYCYGEHKGTKEAYEAFIDMHTKAQESEIKLIINSSYRDYNLQEQTYNNLKKNYGIKRADSQAARPGHSEHESGLAFDIFSKEDTSTATFKDSKTYQWLKENAHHYGFIERYPEGKEYLTGYMFEAWHWRYVGKEIAEKIYQEQITFDEYYAYYLENQN